MTEQFSPLPKHSIADVRQHSFQANIIAGLDSTIHYASPGLNITPDEFSQLNLRDLIVPAHQADFDSTWKKFIDSTELEYETLTHFIINDADIPMVMNIQRLPQGDECLLTVQSKQSVAEQALFPAIQAVTQAIGKQSLEDILSLILSYIVRFVECDGAAIVSLSEQHVFQHWSSEEHHPGDYPVNEVIGSNTTAVLRNTKDYLIIEDTHKSEYWSKLSDLPLRSWLGIPLVYQDGFIGLIDIYSFKVNNFTTEDANIAMNFASQAAMALFNAQSHLELKKRTEHLHAINDVALAISRLNLEGVIEVVYQEISILLDTSSFFIGLYDEKSKMIELHYVHDNGKRMPNYAMVVNPRTSLAAWVLHNQTPMLVNDADYDSLPTESSSYGGETRSLIIVPLIVHDEPVGVLSVQSYEPHKFSQQDVNMLEIIAGPTAIAIRNATLYEDLRSQLELVSNLQELARTIIATEDTQVMMDSVTATLREHFECNACTIILREGKYIGIVSSSGIEPELIEKANREWDFDDTSLISVQVIKSGQAVYISDTHELEFQYLDPQLRSLIVIPLTTKQKILGTLSVDSYMPNAFTAEHERILSIVSSQLAAVLDNRRLLDDLREHTQELKLAYEQLQALDELRHELVNNVSHDLRAPLSFITGYVGLMQAGDLGDITPEQTDALSVIERKVNSILRLIEDIMSMERIRSENLRLQDVDINDLVREAVAGASIAYNTFNLTIRTTDQSVNTRVDPDRINQVLDNLITNAIKYSNKDGFINVSTELVEDGKFVKIAVEDEGVGIPPEKLSRIFERYFQITEHSMAEKGVGLGLAIVQQIVNAHHGRVFVESEVDKGSTFWFTLPL